MKNRKLLNQVEAAELLGVSVNRLAGWLDRGLVPFVKIGRVRKVDRDALLEWYEAQIVRPGEQEPVDSPSADRVEGES